MDYAVLLYFEAEADRLIDQWVNGLSALGLNDRFVNIGMKPHLTLAEFDLTDLSKVEKILSEFADNHKGPTLNFTSLGIFPAEQAVLFLNPIVSEELLVYHRQLNSLLETCCDKFSDLYTEENWVPHCTLGLDFSEEEINKAYHYMSTEFTPLKTRSVSLVLYGCCPYHEMVVFPFAKVPNIEN